MRIFQFEAPRPVCAASEVSVSVGHGQDPLRMPTGAPSAPRGLVERDAERVELVVKLGRARQLSTGARARDHVSSL